MVETTENYLAEISRNVRTIRAWVCFFGWILVLGLIFSIAGILLTLVCGVAGLSTL